MFILTFIFFVNQPSIIFALWQVLKMRSAKWVGDTSTLTLPALLCKLLLSLRCSVKELCRKWKPKSYQSRPRVWILNELRSPHEWLAGFNFLLGGFTFNTADTTIGDNVVWFASPVDLTLNVNLGQSCAIILIWKVAEWGQRIYLLGFVIHSSPGAREHYEYKTIYTIFLDDQFTFQIL